MNPDYRIPNPVWTRLITEFVQEREKILLQGSRGELAADHTRNRVEEIDKLLQVLAAQQKPN
jgi:hypothetical protein